MRYIKEVQLKNGGTVILRSGTPADAQKEYDLFMQTHAETDFLRTYPEENTMTVDDEAEYLRKTEESERNIEILAVLDGKVVGTAGIEAVGSKYKVRHRADFGITVLKEYHGIGIGSALMNACIECAETAGYEQIELTAVADNEKAVRMYRKAGFIEYGRDPRGFKSKYTGYQEIIFMRKEL